MPRRRGMVLACFPGCDGESAGLAARLATAEVVPEALTQAVWMGGLTLHWRVFLPSLSNGVRVCSGPALDYLPCCSSW
jgi:hypothetical protein